MPGVDRAPSQVGPTRFRFLGVEHDVVEHGWDDGRIGKLWRYNLHYFDDLNASDAASRPAWHQDLLKRWIRENPPGVGTGWEPYPTSLRIVNWIKRFWRSGGLDEAAMHSLAVQARWLSKRLEIHLLGNHLFANAKALVFAGLFFEGPEADAWLRRGMRILTEQLPEQILPDGGQFERSPMYHAIALEDVLDLCNATTASGASTARGSTVAKALQDAVAPMRRWLLAMSHPDGEISHFNDAAIGIAPPTVALGDYARRLGFPEEHLKNPVTALRSSGYVRVELGEMVAILDVGPIGPDYLPAHAHADTLSFELSLGGRRALVNSGTSVYAAGAERLRQRGTTAHNTVVVDGADSSEVWSAFRVGRRAQPLELEIIDGDPLVIRCAHDGYRRLAGRPLHRREWRFEGRGLTVTDRLEGDFRTAQARFHLHPLIRVDAAVDGGLDLILPGGLCVHVGIESGSFRIEHSTWHPGFGQSDPSSCLVVDFEGRELRTCFLWGAE